MRAGDGFVRRPIAANIPAGRLGDRKVLGKNRVRSRNRTRHKRHGNELARARASDACRSILRVSRRNKLQVPSADLHGKRDDGRARYTVELGSSVSGSTRYVYKFKRTNADARVVRAAQTPWPSRVQHSSSDDGEQRAYDTVVSRICPPLPSPVHFRHAKRRTVDLFSVSFYSFPPSPTSHSTRTPFRDYTQPRDTIAARTVSITYILIL